jgi:hypothetical protein
MRSGAVPYTGHAPSVAGALVSSVERERCLQSAHVEHDCTGWVSIKTYSKWAEMACESCICMTVGCGGGLLWAP